MDFRARENKDKSVSRFGFGKNWQRFVANYLSEERIASARKALLEKLRKPDLTGATFLDIGCGSGLHSLAAYRASAAQVISFDYDQDAVDVTGEIRKRQGSPANWTVLQGSVLDESFMRSLPSCDIVYSWGVLHHTGNTWKAIENACIPLKSNGVFFVALYSDTAYRTTHIINGFPSPEEWLKIKQSYNSASFYGKKRLEFWLCWLYTEGSVPTTVHGPRRSIRILLQIFRQYRTKRERGMEFWTDVRDWLGGWPMDFVKEKDFLIFARQKLHLEPLDVITGEGNTEYVLRPKGARNYWDEIVSGWTSEPMEGPFNHEGGLCWAKDLSRYRHMADDNEHPRRSPLAVLEDGLLLPLAHSLHAAIREIGEGRYCHWNDKLLFTASDNSDPNTNGKQYLILMRG